MSKKNLLSKMLYGNNFIENIMSKRQQNNIHILAYHRIVDDLSSNYIFNSEVYSSTLEDFDRQMEYVSKNFNVVNFKQLEDSLSNDTVENNTLVVTFDDGYYDNYSLAMPVLNKYGISATIFLATDYIDSGELFWFDAVAGFINTFEEDLLKLSSINLTFDLTKKSRTNVFKTIGSILKNSDDSVRVSLMDEIYNKYNYSVIDEDYEKAKPLSWDNVIEMSQNNIEFGAHSKSHCFLSRISSNQLSSEINESKLKIEKMIGIPVNSFCYPAGDTNQKIMDTVKSSNIFFGVGYKHGLNKKTDIIQYNLNREHVELDVSLELFKANLTMPEVFVR